MDNGIGVYVIFLFNGTDIHSGDYDAGNDHLRKEGDKNPKEKRARAGQVFKTIRGKAWTYLIMRMEIWLCDDWMYLIWCIKNPWTNLTPSKRWTGLHKSDWKMCHD